MNNNIFLLINLLILLQLVAACTEADRGENELSPQCGDSDDCEPSTCTDLDPKKGATTQGGDRWNAPDSGFSSNLPLVVVETFGQLIRGEPKIEANLQIFFDDDGAKNTFVDREPHFNGRVGIETRGCSSQEFAKKQYGIEFWDEADDDRDVSVLDMSAESDWVLHGPYSDKSLMRNHLAYWLSNLVGRWAPRTKYVEAFVNEEGEGHLEDRYSGVYLWIEKIKRNADRVDIAKLTPDRNDSESITGGYIFNHDHVRSPNDCIVSPLEDETRGCLRLMYPKFEDASPQQKAWVRSYFDDFETALEGSDTDYEAFIDVMSFVDHFLLNELFHNSDGLRRSAYMHKDRGGKLVMGPYWDCNICMGNISYHNAWKTDGWHINENVARKELLPYWWMRLPRDETFVSLLATRWREWRSGALTPEAIDQKITETALLLEEAQERNFKRWPTLGVLVKFNKAPFAETWREEVERVRDWLHERIAWIDENITDFEMKE
jgi:hypothetical protein